MGFLKPKEVEPFSRVPLDIRGEVLCRYLKEKESLGEIGEDIFGVEGGQASQPTSQITRAFGFSGKGVAGTYRNVPEKAFYDFASEKFPENFSTGLEEGTFDRWLKQWYQRPENQPDDEEEDYCEDEEMYIPVHIPTPPPIPNPTPRPTPPRPPINNFPDNTGGGSARRKVYVNTSNPLERFAPLLLLAAVCVLLWGGSKVVDFGRGAIFSGQQMLGSVNSFLSTEYQAEIFEYEGAEFVGNQRFNKPEGACMRLDGGMDYTIGYFEGAELNGYGMIIAEDGADLKLGIFKKNQLNGYAILRCNGVDYVAKFKKGVADGYGYCYNNGTEQLVKFKDVSSDLVNFSATEIVAERSGDQWLKPNGKALKMKDNTYKGITWLREGLIAIDDVEYYFDAEVSEAYYDGPETRLSWDAESCEYDSILSDNEGTYLLYTYGEGLEGKHQYKEKGDLLINTFEVSISVD